MFGRNRWTHKVFPVPPLGPITDSAADYVDMMNADGTNINQPGADGTLPTSPTIPRQEEQL